METDEIDIIHSMLFWNSRSYEEYLVQCNLENIEPLFNKEHFDALKHGAIHVNINIPIMTL